MCLPWSPGGPMLAGTHGDEVSLSKMFEAVGAYKAGMITDEQLEDCTCNCCPSCGSCSGMYTANSMNCLCEAIGIALPGNNGTIPAGLSRACCWQPQSGRHGYGWLAASPPARSSTSAPSMRDNGAGLTHLLAVWRWAAPPIPFCRPHMRLRGRWHPAVQAELAKKGPFPHRHRQDPRRHTHILNDKAICPSSPILPPAACVSNMPDLVKRSAGLPRCRSRGPRLQKRGNPSPPSGHPHRYRGGHPLRRPQGRLRHARDIKELHPERQGHPSIESILRPVVRVSRFRP